jgi:formamidopyrimidine-DNA glycosylase
MPELPDLVNIVKRLGPDIVGRSIVSVETGNPVVLRLLLPGSPAGILSGRRIEGLERHGPFLRFALDRHELVMHLMLAGRLKLAAPGEKPIAHRRLSLDLEDRRRLEYGDEKNMGKIYFCDPGQHSQIPLYDNQGLDITGDAFSFEAFDRLIAGKRCQARVFIMDQSLLSAIGNAYADEILFAAGIHPKTPCNILEPRDRLKLYEAVKATMAWGIDEVDGADRPIEEKVRGHLKVRNRGNQPCLVCGGTVRREQVHGHDTFYCPACQPDRTGKSLPWNSLGPPQA